MNINDILDDIVAFRMGENGEWQSNSALWNDPRIKKAWIKRQEALEAGEVEEDDEETEEAPDYMSMRNDDLRVELAARGLSTEGTKADMVARLEEYDAAE